jgi:hypothetical protein
VLLIRPKTVDDTALASSSAAETSPAGYSGVVTYGSGDQVSVLPFATIANRANMTVAAQGSGVYRFTKTGGVVAYDASAVSNEAFTGDFTIRINPLQTNANCDIGPNSDPLTNDSYISLDRSIQFRNDAKVFFRENGGASLGSGVTLTTAQYWFINRTGTTVTAWMGASPDFALATLQYTFTALSGPLYFDSGCETGSAAFDVAVSYVAAGAAPVPIYRSLQAGNIGHDPASSPTYWVANGYVYPAWSSSTLYALADKITDATSHRLLESLSGGTSATVTMTIASPCVVTWNAHGLAANTPITFTTTGALPTGLSVGTIYYVLAPTTNSFNVSATAGGAAINTSGTQSGTHTATANPNLNKAITDPAFWLDIGPSNRWAMFDSYNGTATTDASLIDVTMNLTGRADSLALLALESAISARVIVSTIADGTLYDMTYTLTSTDGIADWYSWFFEEIDRKTNLLLTDLPIYNNPTVRVVLTGTGTSTLECGNLVVGQSKDLGRTLHDGAQVGIIDYSRKEADDFGNYTIVQRAFSKRGSFQMRISKAQSDGIHQVLSDFRATPAVYAATSEYDSTLIFGFFREFNIAIDYPTENLVSIEIEGLT